MIHFYKLTVKEVKRETPDCVSISFEIPQDLADKFMYKQGQYLTIRTWINDEEVRRSYSVCSSPLDKELRIAVKKLDDGIFSRFANEHLKKGDAIEAMPPMGKFFTELDRQHSKHYMAFAAGSGITPIISIIKTTLLTEANSSFTLVYGNRSRQSIIFKDEIEALKNKYINRFNVIYVLSREKMDAPVNFGRIDKAKCQLIFAKAIEASTIDEFFLCGPTEMIDVVKEVLFELGIDQKRVHFELFTAPTQKNTETKAAKINAGLEERSKVTIKLDGIAFDFDLGFDEDSILNAALKKGADLPFACKGGVCCTCKAKLVEGEVEMNVNYGLTPEEVEQGFILTCQSHPRTEKIVVDFDVK